MEKIGIENLKKAVKLGCDLANQGIEVMEDGKFKPLETIQFVDEALQIPGVINSLKDIAAEGGDIDSAERVELVAYAKDSLKIPGPHADAIVDASLDFAGSFLALVEKIKLAKAA